MVYNALGDLFYLTFRALSGGNSSLVLFHRYYQERGILRKNLSLNRVFHKLDNNKWKMHTGARAREQKYISIYISLCMKTFLKTGVYIYIYIWFVWFLFSDKEVKEHLSLYLTKARGLKPEIGHLLQVCQLFVHCWEVNFEFITEVLKWRSFNRNEVLAICL